MKIEDTVALVTGGGSAVAESIASALVAAGSVVVVAHESAQTPPTETAIFGGRLHRVSYDPSSDTDVRRLIDQVLGAHGGLDIVVNSRVQVVTGDPTGFAIADWRATYEANVFDLARMLNIVVPRFAAHGAGHIVNVSSVDGIYPSTYDRVPYSSSMNAVVGLSESLALYARPRGFGVSCLCVGPIDGGSGWRQRSASGEVSGTVEDVHTLGTVSPEVVGEVVVTGIRDGRFLLLTHERAAAKVRQRGEAVDGYLISTADLLHRGDGAETVDPEAEADDWPYANGEEDRKTWLRVAGKPAGYWPASTFRYLTVEMLCKVWSRPLLSFRERRMIVIAVLAMSSMPHEIGTHIRAVLECGDLRRDEIDEIAIQVALYGGWPRGIMIQQVLAEVHGETWTGPPAETAGGK